MKRHIVGRVEDFTPGTQRRVEVNGRGIVVFNVGGRFFALRDVCPHQGARLSDGKVVGAIDASGPGCYVYDRDRAFVKCPWHGWEFELSSGQSWFDPRSERVRSYAVAVADGDAMRSPDESPEVAGRRRGPYVAERLTVVAETPYLVIET